MEEYIRFRETNNWEKERWRFYIPLRGNERAIQILADVLDNLKPVNGCFVGSHIPYDIRLMPTAAGRVDKLCEAYKNKGGYMAWYNKLEGRLDIRAAKRAARLLAKDAKLTAENPKACRFVDDDLYKGGISKMMRPWKRRPSTTDWPTGRIRASLRRTPIHVSGYSARPKRDWGDRLPHDIYGGGFRHRNLADRCWDARTRLHEAGFWTVGEIADLTAKKLLAAKGVGQETVNLARWMLQEIGLDFAV